MTHTTRFVSIAFALALALTAPRAAADQEEPTAAELAKRAAARYKQVESYTATFEKIERIGDKLVGPTEMTLHFRETPFSVHLVCEGPANEGREVLYVKGKHDDKMLVRLGKGFGQGMVIPLAVDSPRALAGNRHPVTRIGLGLLSRRLTDQFAEAKKAGTLESALVGGRELAGRKTWLIKRKLDTGGTRYWHIDRELGLPIRVATYDKDEQLIEQYTYKNLKLDAKLDDDDFDPKKLW